MNIQIDESAQHAQYSPSSAHRWTVCTASALGIATLGEQEEGEEAAEGTRAHDEIERCFSSDWTGRKCPFCKGTGENINHHRLTCSRCGGTGDEHAPVARPDLINPEHPAAYGVALLLNYCLGLSPGQFWVEQRVHLTKQIWGRCDVAHWHAESATLTIVDYKNGFVGVDAEENEQLRIYAAGSIFTHNLPAKWIRLVVVQPRDFRPVPKVKQWTESAESLFAFATRTAAIPHGPLSFVAGEACTYCPLFGRCPASKDVLTKLSVMLANPPDAVPAAQVAMFKACQKPVADWFKGLDKAETKRALSGTVAPGVKLVTATTHRVWENEVEARAAVIAEAGIEALRTPSPAQAEELGMDVSTLAKSPPGGPVLAFASDKRKPFAPRTSSEMFAGIPSVSNL